MLRVPAGLALGARLATENKRILVLRVPPGLALGARLSTGSNYIWPAAEQKGPNRVLSTLFKAENRESSKHRAFKVRKSLRHSAHGQGIARIRQMHFVYVLLVRAVA
jgi:hypothetical protein